MSQIQAYMTDDDGVAESYVLTADELERIKAERDNAQQSLADNKAKVNYLENINIALKVLLRDAERALDEYSDEVQDLREELVEADERSSGDVVTRLIGVLVSGIVAGATLALALTFIHWLGQ